MTRVLGAVLAGGAARRFGTDKALAVLDGRRLIDHAIDTLARQGVAIVLCGRALPGFASVADRPAAGLGPLGGLAGALHAARLDGHDRVLSIPCDAPRLPDDLLARLSAGGGESAAFLRDCPVVGLWPAASGDALEAHLAAGGRSMRGWIARIGAIAVELPGGVLNINTPDDLRRAAG